MLGIRAAVQKRNSRRSPATGNAVIRVTRFWTRPVSLWEFTSSRQESILDSNQVGQLPSLKRSKNPPLEANLFPTAFLCNPLFHIFIIIFGASGEEEEEVFFFLFFFFLVFYHLLLGARRIERLRFFLIWWVFFSLDFLLWLPLDIFSIFRLHRLLLRAGGWLVGRMVKKNALTEFSMNSIIGAERRGNNKKKTWTKNRFTVNIHIDYDLRNRNDWDDWIG